MTTFLAVLLVVAVLAPILWQVPRTFWPVRLNASGTQFTGLYRRYSVESFTGYASGVRTWEDSRTVGSVTAYTTGYVSSGGVVSGASTSIIDRRRTFKTYHTGFFLRDQSGTRTIDAANVGASIGEGHLVSAAWLVHNRKAGNAFLVYNHTTNLVYIEETRRGFLTARNGIVKMVIKLPLAHQVLLWLLIITWPLMIMFGVGGHVLLRGFRKRGSRPLVAALQRTAGGMAGRVAPANIPPANGAELPQGGDLASQVKDLTALHQSGALTSDEFQAAKAKLLG